MLGLVVGIIGIVAVYGVWNQQRWGIILAIMTSLVNGLSAAPGILFAPSIFGQVSATFLVLSSVVIIIFCLWRGRWVVAIKTGA